MNETLESSVAGRKLKGGVRRVNPNSTIKITSLERIDALAEKEECDRSEIIDRCIDIALPMLEEDPSKI